MLPHRLDELVIQLAKLLRRLEGSSLFLFDGFCRSSTLPAAHGKPSFQSATILSLLCALQVRTETNRSFFRPR